MQISMCPEFQGLHYQDCLQRILQQVQESLSPCNLTEEYLGHALCVLSIQLLNSLAYGLHI